MFGVVVDDDPFLTACVLHEDGGVGEGGMAPANLGGVFVWEVLRFMDDEIAIFEELDEP